MLTIERGSPGWRFERFVEVCRKETFTTFYAIIGPFHILWSIKSDERETKTTNARPDEGAGPSG